MGRDRRRRRKRLGGRGKSESRPKLKMGRGERSHVGAVAVGATTQGRARRNNPFAFESFDHCLCQNDSSFPVLIAGAETLTILILFFHFQK